MSSSTLAPPPAAAPSRSLEQRLDALELANDVRVKRAKVKRELKAGRRRIADVLLEPPACCETAKVYDLLLAVPKIGRVKANKVLVQCRISPSKTLGGMSERQRTELVSMLRRPRPVDLPIAERSRLYRLGAL